MAESLYPGTVAREALAAAMEALVGGDAGEPLPVESMTAKAAEFADAEQRAAISERHFLMVLYGPVKADQAAPSLAASAGSANDTESMLGTRLRTPTLDRLGRNLTKAAREGKLLPVFGRDDVVESMIETICRPTKRNPALIGPAGSGKTAIVEGLAQRIASGTVPEMLRASQVYAVQLSDLFAGGNFLERLNQILQEAQQQGVILFIDEMHSITTGIAAEVITTVLKPVLARGDFCCIAATTDNEYRMYIEPDKALERRFQPIRVQELSQQDTLEVLKLRRDSLRSLRDVVVGDNVLEWMVGFAGQYLKNRVFPDKAVDLLEQCIGHCVASGTAEADLETAKAVAERLVGMPLHPQESLNRLDAALSASSLLGDQDRAALMARLGVTVRGLDLSPHRPTAVILLGGDQAGRDSALGGVVAQNLFGSPDRVVIIDFGRFTEDHDISQFLGSPPGYVGYGQNLPIHKAAQMPWCVLICRNVDMCHAQVLGVLRQGLSSGYLTDSSGKRIFLSDAVIIMTAQTFISSEPERHVGLRAVNDDSGDFEPDLPFWLAAVGLDAEIDLTICRSASAVALLSARDVLSSLGDQMKQRGFELTWEPEAERWLENEMARSACDSPREIEAFVERHVTPLFVPYYDADPDGGQCLRLAYRGDTLRVELVESE